MGIGYAWNELRRRWGRTLVTALGLAAGVGLVMGIVGVSNGLSDSQQKVLSPLGSVGTDILVTRTVGVTPASSTSSTSSASGSTATPTASATASPQAGNGGGGGGFFGGGPPGAGGDNGGATGNRGGGLQSLTSLNSSDQAALLAENQSVVTDLSKLGKPGTKFTHDFFVPGTLISFPQAAVTAVSTIPGVTSAVGALSLQAQHETGTVPRIVASVKTGGQKLTTTVRPGPLTGSEQAAVRSCIQSKASSGGLFGSRGTGGGSAPTGAPGGGGGNTGGGPPPAFEQCLPKRYQQYQAQVVEPLRTIQQVVNPPSTDTTTKSYSVAGVQASDPDSGVVTRNQVTGGTWFTKDAAHEVLVNTAYANTAKLAVGDSLTVNGTTYKVVGLVSPTLTGNVSDIYFDLGALQKMSSKTARVNEVLVKADSAADVDAIAAQIQKQLPGAQVVTAKTLAAQVSGSLSDAHDVASRLGGVLAGVILLGAFVIAILLTLASVGKRTREIGTLRALGWTRRRIVGQIELEAVGIGLLGGVIGVLLGYAVAAMLGAFGPTLSATSSGASVGNSTLGQLFGRSAQTVTTSVPLTAPIGFTTILLGIAVALLGGLLAGAIGGWRAARLSPAEALRDLG